MAFLTLFLECLLAVLSVYYVRLYIRKRGQLPLPPGPKGLPLVGNILQMPTSREHETFIDWSRKYGDVMYAKVLNRQFIIINSREAAYDLFERRATNYSGRAERVMLRDLMCWGWNFGFMDYGDRWRRHRKEFHLGFNPQVLKPFIPAHELACKTLLKTLVEQPNMHGHEAKRLCHFYISIVLLDVVYGYIVKKDNDEVINLCEDAMDSLTPVLNTTFAVDLFPFLKHVPAWFPFAKFKRDAAVWGKSVIRMRDYPYEWTKQSGLARHSMVREALSRVQSDQDSDILRDTAAMGYGAGVDTTKATMRTFIYAMLKHREAQKKAQIELDSVLGEPGTRMPTYEDKESLPYLQAVISEVLRWRPVIPIGLPHRCMSDDVYRDYHIPEGSIVIGNIWAILHNEKDYPDPETFKPERFLTKPGEPKPLDPSVAVWGFGRRICPGRYLAMDILYFAAASILSNFDILPVMDENGQPIIPGDRFLEGSVAHPQTFPCRFVPRSKKVVEMVSNFDITEDI